MAVKTALALMGHLRRELAAALLSLKGLGFGA